MSVIDGTSYAMGRSDPETRRLQLQGSIYAPATAALISAAGIGAGQTVVDIGCGAGDVTMLLALGVGESGTVIAVDNDPAMIELTRQRVEDAGLRNVELRTADALTPPLEPASVDAVVGRLILIHLADRAAAVARFGQLLKPGGTLLLMEFDTSQARSVPSVPQFDRTVSAISAALRRAGADPDLGSALPLILHQSGFGRVDGMITGPVCGDPGTAATYAATTLGSLWPLAAPQDPDCSSPAAIAATTDALRAELNAAAAVACFPQLIGAWSAR